VSVAAAIGVSNQWPFTSLIEPLPHPITAVYEEMISRQPPRYVLADDPDEGEASITGIFIKKPTGRGDSERCLIVCPGNLLTYK